MYLKECLQVFLAMLYATCVGRGTHQAALSSQACGGGQAHPSLPPPHTCCLPQPGGITPALPRPGLPLCAKGEAASWASQPAGHHRPWLAPVMGAWAMRACLRWWGTDTLPAVLPSCGNLDPHRFVCTPASLLARPAPQPH